MISTIWNAMLRAASVKVWAQISAAMIFTAIFVLLEIIIWKGPWEPEHQTEQLNWLGYGVICMAILNGIALAAITGLNLNLKGSKDGVSASIDQEDHPSTVETVTTTTIKPGEKP